MNKPLTKRRIREALGFSTDVEVAAFFGVSASAVSQWAEDDPIPELRQLQAERKRPDVFGPEPDDRDRRTAAAEEGTAAQADEVAVQTLSEAA